jgi:hypothetical protein
MISANVCYPEELAKLTKPSGMIGSNGQKRKMSLFKSDKVEWSKTRKSSANEQVTRDFSTSLAEHPKLFISLVGGRVGSVDGEATRIGYHAGTGAH